MEANAVLLWICCHLAAAKRSCHYPGWYPWHGHLNIVVQGAHGAQQDACPEHLLQSFMQHVTLNVKKCLFRVEDIEFLGITFSSRVITS